MPHRLLESGELTSISIDLRDHRKSSISESPAHYASSDERLLHSRCPTHSWWSSGMPQQGNRRSRRWQQKPRKVWPGVFDEELAAKVITVAHGVARSPVSWCTAAALQSPPLAQMQSVACTGGNGSLPIMLSLRCSDRPLPHIVGRRAAARGARHCATCSYRGLAT